MRGWWYVVAALVIAGCSDGRPSPPEASSPTAQGVPPPTTTGQPEVQEVGSAPPVPARPRPRSFEGSGDIVASIGLPGPAGPVVGWLPGHRVDVLPGRNDGATNAVLEVFASGPAPGRVRVDVVEEGYGYGSPGGVGIPVEWLASVALDVGSVATVTFPIEVPTEDWYFLASGEYGGTLPGLAAGVHVEAVLTVFWDDVPAGFTARPDHWPT